MIDFLVVVTCCDNISLYFETRLAIVRNAKIATQLGGLGCWRSRRLLTMFLAA